MQHTPCLSSDYVALLFEILEQNNISPISIIDALNFPWPLPSMVSISTFESLLDYIISNHSIDNLGLLMAIKSGTTGHGFLGYAAKSSDTIEDALSTNAMYLTSRIEGVSLHVIKGELESEIVIEMPFNKHTSHFFSQFILGTFFAFFVELFPKERLPATVKFNTKKDHSFKQFKQQFPSVQYQFEQTVNSVLLPNSLLAMVLPTKDKMLKQLLLAKIPNSATVKTYSSLVEELLMASLNNPMSQSDIAAWLHINERTLKRKLQAEQTSYRQLLTSLRLKQIDKILRSESITAEKLAEKMGYASYSSFMRLFKNWTGTTYLNYIKQLSTKDKQ